MVLAGGRGVRLGHLTEEMPKPMIRVAGIPLLERQTRWLVAGGVTDIVFLLVYKPEVIARHFRSGDGFGFKAHYCVMDTLSYGTGGMVRLGLSFLPSGVDQFILTNGDVVTDEPVSRIPDHPDGHTVMSVKMPSSYGVLEIMGDQIAVFHEALVSWINAGIYILHRDVVLPTFGSIEEALAEASRNGHLYVYKSEAWWRSLDSFKDLEAMEQHFSSGGTP